MGFGLGKDVAFHSLRRRIVSRLAMEVMNPRSVPKSDRAQGHQDDSPVFSSLTRSEAACHRALGQYSYRRSYDSRRTHCTNRCAPVAQMDRASVS